jgi:hypothetical protein
MKSQQSRRPVNQQTRDPQQNLFVKHRVFLNKKNRTTKIGSGTTKNVLNTNRQVKGKGNNLVPEEIKISHCNAY